MGLEHLVSGDYYWLTCTIRFCVGDDSDLYIHRSDAELILLNLEVNGFKQTRETRLKKTSELT